MTPSNITLLVTIIAIDCNSSHSTSNHRLTQGKIEGLRKVAVENYKLLQAAVDKIGGGEN